MIKEKIEITVIKNPTGCFNCEEAEQIAKKIASKYTNYEISLTILNSNQPEAQEFGIITTPVIAINKKIYSMGKPLIPEKVEIWVKKELEKMTQK